MFHAKNGNVKLNTGDMDYISFGHGNKNLIFIPGLGDGLMSVKGKAIPFAMMYRMYAKSHKVYVFSRKNQLVESYTTRMMADDIACAMDMLNIRQADIIGVSQGGMIAQYLALDYPDKVNKLVLAVTCSHSNPTVNEVISYWIDLAKSDNYEELMLDNLRKMYSSDYLKKNKWMELIAGKFGKPKTFERFIIQANACLTHDTYERLSEISHDTLVIGGEKDYVLEGNSSKEIAEKIQNSQLVMYEDLGHACYEEAKDFNKIILDFLNR